MTRPLAFQLIIDLPSAPPALTSRGWAWALQNKDADLLAAIARLGSLDDAVREAAKATATTPVRIAWLKRADVDIREALALCAAETRIAVWKTLCEKFRNNDDLTARLLDVLCAKPSIGMAELVRDRVSVNTLNATELHAVADACSGRDMDRNTAYAWRRWFMRAHGQSASTLLSRADVWDLTFLDVAVIVLRTDGRDPNTLAADTAAVAASASGGALLSLTQQGLQRYLQAPKDGPAATDLRTVVDILMAAAGQHGGVPSAELAALRDKLDAHDHPDPDDNVEWSQAPAELGLARLHNIEATTPMLADTIDGAGVTFRVGDGQTQSCWADIRDCLANPDDDVAGYAWQLAYRSGMELGWGEFPAGVTRVRDNPDVWPYVRGMVLCCDDANNVNFDADTLTALSYAVTSALDTAGDSNSWRLARIRDGWLAEKLHNSGRWADIPWPSLQLGLHRASGRRTGHVEAYAWLATQVEACEDPELLWTLLDRISATFTGSLGQLLAAGAEVCGQQLAAGTSNIAQPNVVLVDVA